MRGAGATSEQMRDAPAGAVFVWPNGNLGYPKHLARYLGREDLRIVSMQWVIDRRYLYAPCTVVLDHAVWLPRLASHELEAWGRARR